MKIVMPMFRHHFSTKLITQKIFFTYKIDWKYNETLNIAGPRIWNETALILCIIHLLLFVMLVARALESTPMKFNMTENRILEFEPAHEKTNNLCYDQVWHKPACTVTEAG